MFGIFNKTDRYNELFQHLTLRWKMKSGYASAFLNEYRGAISKQYDKASKQTRSALLSKDSRDLEIAYSEVADWALVGQAYHSYRTDLLSGKNVGTNIEMVIWAILLTRIDLIEGLDKAFASFLSREHEKRFPNLIQTVFHDPLFS